MYRFPNFPVKELDERTTLSSLSGLRSGLMDLGNLDFPAGNVDIENRNRVDRTGQHSEHGKNYNISYLGSGTRMQSEVFRYRRIFCHERAPRPSYIDRHRTAIYL